MILLSAVTIAPIRPWGLPFFFGRDSPLCYKGLGDQQL